MLKDMVFLSFARKFGDKYGKINVYCNKKKEYVLLELLLKE